MSEGKEGAMFYATSYVNLDVTFKIFTYPYVNTILHKLHMIESVA
jgi:hypothetical protein